MEKEGKEEIGREHKERGGDIFEGGGIKGAPLKSPKIANKVQYTLGFPNSANHSFSSFLVHFESRFCNLIPKNPLMSAQPSIDPDGIVSHY